MPLKCRVLTGGRLSDFIGMASGEALGLKLGGLNLPSEMSEEGDSKPKPKLCLETRDQ